MHELEKYPAAKQWLGLLRAESTKELYGSALNSFCKQVEKTPTQLVKLKEAQIRKLVIDYLTHLTDMATKRAGKTTKKIPRPGETGDSSYKISVNSIRYYMSGIKSFLDFHEKELKWKSIEKYYPERVTNGLRAYTLEEIRKMLALVDRRERVAVLLMVSGGVRIGAIPSLKMKHLKKLENGMAKLHVYSESANDCYWTLLSPECVSAIEEYKRFRMEQIGEKITPESLLVRDAFKVRPIAVGTLSKTIWEIFRKCEMPKEELQPDHAFRKYFNTVCINTGMNHTIKECLMGHSVRLDDTYYDLTNETTLKKVISEYEKAIPELTITEEARTGLSMEMKLRSAPVLEKVQAENKNLRDRLERLEKEDSDRDRQELGEIEERTSFDKFWRDNKQLPQEELMRKFYEMMQKKGK